MNPLLRKELRLLLPAWVAALAAATVPLWLRWDYRFWWLPCFGVAILCLGLTPFGQEMSWGTFGLLLAQPEKRQRFWRIKTGLLALALLSAWGLFSLCCRIAINQTYQLMGESYSPSEMAKVSGLMALLAFSGGLWSTLLLRDVTTAFFAALLVPLVVFGGTVLCLGGFDNMDGDAIYPGLGTYAVVGFFAAWRLFLGAQDVPWTGGQISLSPVRGLSFGWLGLGFQKKRGTWVALICKELQLQEVTMSIVPLLLLFHLAALAARHFVPAWARRFPDLDLVSFVWMLAVPMLVGCVAVAEERRYNTLESHLCLPVRQRIQFAVKFAVVMALGTVLGGVFPWVLENMGGGHKDLIGFDQLKGLICIAAIITAISFFASTMSRGMLQAFAVGLLSSILLGIPFIILIERISRRSDMDIMGYRASLTWPVVLIAYFWLAFRNYQRLQTDWRLWAGNLIKFGAVSAATLLLADEICTIM